MRNLQERKHDGGSRGPGRNERDRKLNESRHCPQVALDPGDLRIQFGEFRPDIANRGLETLKRPVDAIDFRFDLAEPGFERSDRSFKHRILRAASSAPFSRFEYHQIGHGSADFSISMGIGLSLSWSLRCCSMCPQRLHANVMTGSRAGEIAGSPIMNDCRVAGKT
ncbi:MAG: hypothetical protein ABR970_19480 [Roseiarcus sp.]